MWPQAITTVSVQGLVLKMSNAIWRIWQMSPSRCSAPYMHRMTYVVMVVADALVLAMDYKITLYYAYDTQQVYRVTRHKPSAYLVLGTTWTDNIWHGQ